MRDDYEYPSIESFRLALSSLVGRELHAPPQSGLAPLWPCAVGWHAAVWSAMKRPVLVFGAVDPSEAARLGELRVIFNDGVHCYSLKQTGAAEEAPWVDRWRRAWLGSAPRRTAARAARREHAAAAEPAAPGRLARARARLAARRRRLRGARGARGDAAARARVGHARAAPGVARARRRRAARARAAAPRAAALVLDREGDAHSDLSLDSAAELLHAAITAEPALRGAALEACEGSLRSWR